MFGRVQVPGYLQTSETTPSGHVCIVVIGAFYCLHFYLSVCLHVSSQLLLDRFMWNLVLEIFMKICQEIPDLFKIRQKYQAFYVKT